ncbi:unnamed protein product [Prorocentrum cordatum]|uniref:SH3 domain-containing protein n=1 Tax=Prorocentrum cordatum TaxID=2364126 RepID=A0ABN9U8R3_9DINO|nr:unnamed protein product [Polarella glacialis]
MWPPPFAPGDVCVTVSEVTVRVGEETSSDIIEEFLPQGTELEVIRIGKGRRIQVRSTTLLGWISFETIDGDQLVEKLTAWSSERPGESFYADEAGGSPPMLGRYSDGISFALPSPFAISRQTSRRRPRGLAPLRRGREPAAGLGDTPAGASAPPLRGAAVGHAPRALARDAWDAAGSASGSMSARSMASSLLSPGNSPRDSDYSQPASARGGYMDPAAKERARERARARVREGITRQRRQREARAQMQLLTQVRVFAPVPEQTARASAAAPGRAEGEQEHAESGAGAGAAAGAPAEWVRRARSASSVVARRLTPGQAPEPPGGAPPPAGGPERGCCGGPLGRLCFCTLLGLSAGASAWWQGAAGQLHPGKHTRPPAPPSTPSPTLTSTTTSGKPHTLSEALHELRAQLASARAAAEEEEAQASAMLHKATAEAEELRSSRLQLGAAKIALQDAELKKLALLRRLQAARGEARRRAGLLGALGELPFQRVVALAWAALGARGICGQSDFSQAFNLASTSIAGSLLLVSCLGYFLASRSALYSDAVQAVLAGRAPLVLYLVWSSLLALALLRWYTGYRVCWVAYVDEVVMTDDGGVVGMRNDLPTGLRSPLLRAPAPKTDTADQQAARAASARTSVRDAVI